jgi:hypothetical protein
MRRDVARRTLASVVSQVLDDVLADYEPPLSPTQFELVRRRINADRRIRTARIVGPSEHDKIERNYIDQDGYPVECVWIKPAGRGPYQARFTFGPASEVG